MSYHIFLGSCHHSNTYISQLAMSQSLSTPKSSVRSLLEQKGQIPVSSIADPLSPLIVQMEKKSISTPTTSGICLDRN